MPRHDQDNPIKDAIRARGVRNIDLARMAGCSPARMSACLGSGRLGYGRLRRVVLEAAGWDEMDLRLVLENWEGTPEHEQAELERLADERRLLRELVGEDYL